MFLRQRNLLLLIVLLILVGCQSSQMGDQQPFTRYNYFDFEAEVARLIELKPLVEKTVLSNGTSETATDTLSWKRELALFLTSDINNSRNTDRYDISVEEGNAPGNRKVTYRAKEAEQQVQIIEHTFANNACQRIYIKRGISSRFQESWQELTYEPGSGYHILGHQDVELSFESEMEIRARFVNTDTRWHGVLDLEDDALPFMFDWQVTGDAPRMVIYNGAEAIEATEVTLNGDSFMVQLPVFLSSITGVVKDGRMVGVWKNEAKGPRYNLNFSATYGNKPRFNSKDVVADFSGKWEVDFSPETEDFYKAIGIFNQNGSNVTGTFLTETGDYRYLEGAVSGDSLLLSTFDGAHAFLFKAAMTPDGIVGQFRSGKHWSEPWVGTRNEAFELTNPDSLTYLMPGYDRFNFEVTDRDSNVITLDDERFLGKVTIVQILGTWCPNCMDETAYLAELHEAYNEKGLEIVGLCFERCCEDNTHSYRAMDRLTKHFDLQYPFYLAGPLSKKSAGEAFPMLNEIISFPTTVFIDRKGNVRKIHTGFYGPGTGDYYTRYVEHTDEFVRALLMEKAS